MNTIHTIGRRKQAVARIYLSKGKGNIIVNGKDFKEYFPVDTMQYKLEQPFKIADLATHADLMLIAHQDARFLLNEDPTLTGKRGKAAKTLLYLMEKENSIPLISIG